MEKKLTSTWDPKTVYAERYLQQHSRTFNGYNLFFMGSLHFCSSQLLKSLSAINKLARTDDRFEFLAEMGNCVKDDLYAILKETAKWSNGLKTWGEKSNHYKNATYCVMRYDGSLSSYDMLVLRDIKNDYEYSFKRLVQLLSYMRDSEFERDVQAIQDLPKLAGFIEDLIVYLELLNDTDFEL